MKRMKAIITYLRQLQANNNREWFNAHKDEFLKHQARFHELVEEVIKEISVFDPAIANLTPKDCTIESIAMSVSRPTKVRISVTSGHL